MDIRRVENPVIRRVAEGLHQFNSRHPWSHNDHFHRWILANLPDRRGAAIDVGCGQGALVAQLGTRFARVGVSAGARAGAQPGRWLR